MFLYRFAHYLRQGSLFSINTRLLSLTTEYHLSMLSKPLARERLLKFAASTIAAIYKSRWQIKLFFIWIKQNLKIKSFLGPSKNAVLSQIWVAMSYCLLLTYIKNQTKYQHSLLTLSRIVRMLFERKNLIDIFTLKPERLLSIKDEPIQGVLF